MTQKFHPIIQAELDAINDKLPPAIRATLVFSRGVRSVQFSVRYEHKGRKHSLGSFLTVDGALTALFEHKYKGLVKISPEELQARIDTVRLADLQAGMGQENISPAGVAGVAGQSLDKSLDKNEARMLELQELFYHTGTPGHELLGERTLERMDAKGNLHIITPALQIAYNIWLQASMETADEAAGGEKLMGQEDEQMTGASQETQPTQPTQAIGQEGQAEELTWEQRFEQEEAGHAAKFAEEEQRRLDSAKKLQEELDNSGAQQSGETDADYDARMAALFGLD